MTDSALPEDDLELMPRGVRDKLDRIDVKIHLRDWQAMPLGDRILLRDLPCENEEDVARYFAEVERLVVDVTGRPPERLERKKA